MAAHQHALKRLERFDQTCARFYRAYRTPMLGDIAVLQVQP
jgi:hypothetical protein